MRVRYKGPLTQYSHFIFVFRKENDDIVPHGWARSQAWRCGIRLGKLRHGCGRSSKMQRADAANISGVTQE